ncbi:hypothetical protein NDU88_006059 [Pleurodeles waltl]|uniref:Uncharacterized protein n=1 Tax=Pleurodeles waltl TaxID=8319 RepID=A0AAV7ULQ5_PLEWA|nr:hypothetical protein NDU88_006059 [Pleurodeles waltl]
MGGGEGAGPWGFPPGTPTTLFEPGLAAAGTRGAEECRGAWRRRSTARAGSRGVRREMGGCCRPPRSRGERTGARGTSGEPDRRSCRTAAPPLPLFLADWILVRVAAGGPDLVGRSRPPAGVSLRAFRSPGPRQERAGPG